MKTRIVIGTLVAVTLIFTFGMVLYAQPAGSTFGEAGWVCPWYGQWNSAPRGMAWGCGSYAPACYHACLHGHPKGWGYGPGHSSWSSQSGQPLTLDQAKTLVAQFLTRSGIPNLKLGDVVDKGDYYEAQIETGDGSLVNTLQVNKNTGWFRFVK